MYLTRARAVFSSSSLTKSTIFPWVPISIYWLICVLASLLFLKFMERIYEWYSFLTLFKSVGFCFIFFLLNNILLVISWSWLSSWLRVSRRPPLPPKTLWISALGTFLNLKPMPFRICVWVSSVVHRESIAKAIWYSLGRRWCCHWTDRPVHCTGWRWIWRSVGHCKYQG